MNERIDVNKVLEGLVEANAIDEYGNAGVRIEACMRQQQAEIERLQRLCESYIRSDYEGTSMFKPFMEELYGKAQEK